MTQAALRGALLGLAMAAGAIAAPPSLQSMTPHGARRGSELEVVFAGPGVGRGAPALVGEVPGTWGPLVIAGPDRVSARLSLPAEAPVGPSIVAIRTENGLTAAQVFWVDDLPQSVEVEPNDDPARATLVTWPGAIEGRCQGTDRDLFRFHAEAGVAIGLEVFAARLGSDLEPALSVRDASGRLMPLERSGRRGDPLVGFKAPRAGEYVVIVEDLNYQTGANAFYRLRAGTFAAPAAAYPLGWRAGERFEARFVGGTASAPMIRMMDGLGGAGWIAPGDGSAAPVYVVAGERPEVLEGEADPTPLAVGTVRNGRLAQPGERDRFALAVMPGQKLRATIEAARLGSPLDPVLTIAGPDGKELLTVDDGAGLDPGGELTVPGGVDRLTIEVADRSGRGGSEYAYRFLAVTAVADFALSVPSAAITIRPGTVAMIPVNVERRGLKGPIQLSLQGDLEGISARGGLVPAGSEAGTLLVTAADTSTPRVLDLEVWGQAGSPAQPIRRRAGWGGGASALAARDPARIPAALGRGLPIQLTLDREAATVPHGSKVEFTLTVARPPGQAEPIALETVGAPKGLGGGEAKPTIAADAKSIVLGYTPGDDIKPGPLVVPIRATTKVDGIAETIDLPPITLTVQRPFDLEVITPELALAPGEAGAVVALVRRNPPFDGPVKVRLSGGAPAGVTIEEMVIAKEALLASVPIRIAPDAVNGPVTFALQGAADVPGRRRTKDYVLPDSAVKLTIRPR